MRTLCKFKCDRVTKFKNWNTSGPEFLYDAQFSAVTSGSDENKTFFGSTPTGRLEVTSINEDTFQPGQEYYLMISDSKPE